MPWTMSCHARMAWICGFLFPASPGADVVRGVVGDLGVVGQVRRQHGIGRQIRLVREQRRIAAQHVPHRGRVLTHQLLELLPGLLRVEGADGLRRHGLGGGHRSGRLGPRLRRRGGLRDGLWSASARLQGGRQRQERDERKGGKTAAHVGGSRVKNCYLANTPGLPVG